MTGNPISDIILGEIVQSEQVLIERGYIFIDDEKQNMITNNIPELLEQAGIAETDLSALTGITRQNLNMIIQNRVKPSVDLALKLSVIFNIPVEKIFKLNQNAWFDKISGFKDSGIYLQTNNNKVIGKAERDANIKETGAEYWHRQTGELISKTQYQNLLKEYLNENSEQLMQQLLMEYPELTRNERLSTAQQQLKETFAHNYPRLYKKIGRKIDPQKKLRECREKYTIKNKRSKNKSAK